MVYGYRGEDSHVVVDIERYRRLKDKQQQHRMIPAPPSPTSRGPSDPPAMRRKDPAGPHGDDNSARGSSYRHQSPSRRPRPLPENVAPNSAGRRRRDRSSSRTPASSRKSSNLKFTFEEDHSQSTAVTPAEKSKTKSTPQQIPTSTKSASAALSPRTQVVGEGFKKLFLETLTTPSPSQKNNDTQPRRRRTRSSAGGGNSVRTTSRPQTTTNASLQRSERSRSQTTTKKTTTTTTTTPQTVDGRNRRKQRFQKYRYLVEHGVPYGTPPPPSPKTPNSTTKGLSDVVTTTTSSPLTTTRINRAPTLPVDNREKVSLFTVHASSSSTTSSGRIPDPSAHYMRSCVSSSSSSYLSSSRRDRIEEARSQSEEQQEAHRQRRQSLEDGRTSTDDDNDTEESSSPANRPAALLKTNGPDMIEVARNQLCSSTMHRLLSPSNQNQCTTPRLIDQDAAFCSSPERQPHHICSGGGANDDAMSNDPESPIYDQHQTTSKSTDFSSYDNRYTTTVPSPTRRLQGSSSTQPTPTTTTTPNHSKMDLRTIRLLHGREFAHLVQQQQNSTTISHETINVWRHHHPNDDTGVTLMVRKRPVLQSEISKGDFDVVSNDGAGPFLKVHQTGLDDASHSLKVLATTSYDCFDSIFMQDRTSEEVYLRSCQPMVLAAREGQRGCLLLCGGRGSGKTFSLLEMEELAAHDIFAIPQDGPDNSYHHRSAIVSVQVVEINDNSQKCHDLLGQPGSRVGLSGEGKGEIFRFKGALTRTANNAQSLLTILSDANQRQPQRGSSHRVCHMMIRRERHRGYLTLVETSNQFMNHEKSSSSSSFQSLAHAIQFRRENLNHGNVNLSQIMATPSCLLMRVLRSTLEDTTSKICLLATVAPTATETENTLDTLESMKAFSVQETPTKTFQRMTPSTTTIKREGTRPRYSLDSTSSIPENEPILPRQWTNADLVDFMERKNLVGNKSVPLDINGRLAMRMTKNQLKATFYNSFEDDKASRLHAALRAENDRVARLRVKRRIAQEREKRKSYPY